MQESNSTRSERRAIDIEQIIPVVPPALPEVRVGRKIVSRRPNIAMSGALASMTKPVDLTGRRKVILVVGRGKTGKTTTLRYLLEEALIAGRQLVIADADKTNPVLDQFVEGALSPPAYDDATIAEWVVNTSFGAVDAGYDLVLDLGAGDSSLAHLIDVAPSFASELEQRGGALVALCTLGQSVDDLGPIITLRTAGFRPTATALLLNQGIVTTSSAIGQEPFGGLLRHSAFAELLAQGAVPLILPKLHAAEAVESRRLFFQDALNGTGPAGVRPLGPFERLAVRDWLGAMQIALAPIESWLP